MHSYIYLCMDEVPILNFALNPWKIRNGPGVGSKRETRASRPRRRRLHYTFVPGFTEGRRDTAARCMSTVHTLLPLTWWVGDPWGQRPRQGPYYHDPSRKMWCRHRDRLILSEVMMSDLMVGCSLDFFKCFTKYMFS